MALLIKINGGPNMAGIVSGMFGIDPEQLRQSRAMETRQAAMDYANQSPMQQAQSMIYQGGAGLGTAVGGALGFQNPAELQARSRQEIGSQMDMTTPQGYYAAAQEAQRRGDVQLAANLVAAGRELESSMVTGEFKQAQAQRMTQEKPRATKTIKAVVDRGEEQWNALVDAQTGDVVRYLSKVVGKGAATKDSGASIVDAKFTEIENAMADTLGIQREELNSFVNSRPKETANRLEETTGFLQGASPAWMQGQKQVDIRSHLERLKSLGQTMGLADLRAAGVAPGSVTEREWPKFQADLANIDTTLSGQALANQYKRIIDKMAKFREEMKKDSGKGSKSDAKKEMSIEDRLAKYK